MGTHSNILAWRIHGQRSLATVHGVKESNTTERRTPSSREHSAWSCVLCSLYTSEMVCTPPYSTHTPLQEFLIGRNHILPRRSLWLLGWGKQRMSGRLAYNQ